MSDLKRIAALLQYWGTHYVGLQRQKNARTIQGELETQLGKICGHEVMVYAAGRTDTGVHALGQVIHFDTTARIPPENWPIALNSRLPSDLMIRQAVIVDPPWHSRFSATWREYVYTIHDSSVPDLYWRDRSWFYWKGPLNVAPMREALQTLIGTHDLRTFQLAGSSRAHSIVRVYQVHCFRMGELVYIRVRASGFLYGMMRLLVGLLVRVGMQEVSPTEFKCIWHSQERDQTQFLAPPQGLSLVEVGYPQPIF